MGEQKNLRICALSEHLDGKSVYTIYNMAEAGRIPHERAGLDLLFDLEIIDQWMKAHGNGCAREQRTGQ